MFYRRNNLPPSGEAQRVEKGVLVPWPPLRGAPPAGGGGEELYGCRNISGYGRFSPSAPSGHLPRRGRFSTAWASPRGSHLPVSSPIEHRACASVAEHLDPARDVQPSLPPRGKLSVSKKVCSSLGPLCEGAPPAGGGGENCTAVRNISGYGKVLSLRPFGAPPSQREVFRQPGLPPRGKPFTGFLSDRTSCLRLCR